MTPAIKWIQPGDIVTSKGNQTVSLWSEFETRFNEFDDNLIRIKLSWRNRYELRKPILALVIAVNHDYDIPDDNDIVMLFLPEKQMICYTWSTWLVKIQ